MAQRGRCLSFVGGDELAAFREESLTATATTITGDHHYIWVVVCMQSSGARLPGVESWLCLQ